MNNIIPNLRRCLFLLLLVSLVTPDGKAQRFGPRIVFASNRDGDWDIYSMDVNGNNLLQLTNHEKSDRALACSPDGRKIAFRSERDGPPDLYVMDNDGNNVIRLTNSNSFESRPSWSPDGKKIAFSSSCENNCDIFTVDTVGENRTRLAQHEMGDVVPSWSPDGSKIAFASLPPGVIAFADYHIFVMNADGKKRRNLTGDTGLTGNFSPTWSPDGKKIAFDSQRNFIYDIYVISAEGKKLERLTEGEGNNTRPAYVQDGTRIAFESDRDGAWNIYLMNTNGRNAIQLTRTPPGTNNSHPSWLPRALAANPNGKLPISWGVLKRSGNPR